MKKMLTHAVSYHGRKVEGEIKIERKVGRLSQLQQWYTNQPLYLDFNKNHFKKRRNSFSEIGLNLN